MAAAYIPLTTGTLHQATGRGKVYLPRGAVAPVTDVQCRHCRQPYARVFDEPCAATMDNTHLIGGDQAQRVKRAHNHDCFAHGCNTAEVVAAQQARHRIAAGT